MNIRRWVVKICFTFSASFFAIQCSFHLYLTCYSLSHRCLLLLHKIGIHVIILLPSFSALFPTKSPVCSEVLQADSFFFNSEKVVSSWNVNKNSITPQLLNWQLRRAPFQSSTAGVFIPNSGSTLYSEACVYFWLLKSQVYLVFFFFFEGQNSRPVSGGGVEYMFCTTIWSQPCTGCLSKLDTDLENKQFTNWEVEILLHCTTVWKWHMKPWFALLGKHSLSHCCSQLWWPCGFQGKWHSVTVQ